MANKYTLDQMVRALRDALNGAATTAVDIQDEIDRRQRNLEMYLENHKENDTSETMDERFKIARDLMEFDVEPQLRDIANELDGLEMMDRCRRPQRTRNAERSRAVSV